MRRTIAAYAVHNCRNNAYLMYNRATYALVLDVANLRLSLELTN